VNTTFDVRVHGILAYQGKRATTYTVRWRVAGRPFRQTFATKALAESERSKLLIAQRSGVAFDVDSGRPEPEARRLNARTWVQHAMAFVDMKWPHVSPKHRRSMADALATVTPVFVTTERGAPSAKVMRDVLYGWAFNKARRDAETMPAEAARVLEWLKANTVAMADVDDAALIRKALDALALRIDGIAAAATTVARKRAVFSGALKYAVELRLLESHPFARVSWTPRKANDTVDRRTVVNPSQARQLLARARKRYPDLEAFLASLYYAALRPEEALHLARSDYESPGPQSGGWGWFLLSGATVSAGRGWGDTGETFEARGLKHRAATATRRVPVAPPLAEILDRHIERCQIGPNGKLFRSGRGQPIATSTYTRAWRNIRVDVLDDAQQSSPLARRPYDLRHAAVSLWLNAGVPATQVAEWAGHSVAVLLKVYAQCIDGEEDAAKRRILAALDISVDGPAAVSATKVRI
jgi:integrase